MKVKVLNICMIILILVPQAVYAAPKTWNLYECMDYAIKNNIQIRQLRNETEKSKLLLSNAKKSRLPNLFSSVSQNFSFGRSLSVDNLYINQNVNTTSFSLSSEIPLFTGFCIPNTIKLNMLNYLACKSDVEKMENLLCLNIFEAYTQILFNKENLKIFSYQVELDSIQLESIRELEQSGRLSFVDVSRQIALLSQSRLSYTQCLTNLRSSFLLLTQLMNLHSMDEFDVENTIGGIVNEEINNPIDIYRCAMMNRPEIQSEKYRVEAALRAIRIAKSNKYPKISLSGGLGTHYYYSSNVLNETFFHQFKNKFNKYISLNMNIPIFNRFETKNNFIHSLYSYDFWHYAKFNYES